MVPDSKISKNREKKHLAKSVYSAHPLKYKQTLMSTSSQGARILGFDKRVLAIDLLLKSALDLN